MGKVPDHDRSHAVVIKLPLCIHSNRWSFLWIIGSTNHQSLDWWSSLWIFKASTKLCPQILSSVGCCCVFPAVPISSIKAVLCAILYVQCSLGGNCRLRAEPNQLELACLSQQQHSCRGKAKLPDWGGAGLSASSFSQVDRGGIEYVIENPVVN